MKKKYLFIVLTLLVTLGFIVPVKASSKQVNTKITKFTILNWAKNETSSIYETNSFYLSIDWDASGLGASLHEGDYFDVNLPDQMIFPSDSSHCDFHLYAKDGHTIIANAHVSPLTKGGKVRVTFTDYVNNKYNVKGNMFLSAHFNTKDIEEGEKNTFELSVNGQVATHSIKVIGATDIKNEVLNKWGYQDSNPNNAHWAMRINHDKRSLDNVIITDNLLSTDETYIKDSFKLKEVEFTSRGGIISQKNVDIKDKITFNSNLSSFTLNLGKVDKVSYYLTYKSTYTPGVLLRNTATLKSGEKTWKHVAGYRSSDAGGSGDGDLVNKIKIIKEDKDTKERLKNVNFVLKNIKTNKTYSLTTDEDGEAVSERLESGDYTIEESKAPLGYIKDDKVYPITLKDGQSIIKTITNESIKRNIKVTKKWHGEKKEVKVKLLSNDKEIDNVILNDQNNWTYTFKDLPKYKEEKEIQYHVEEKLEGYTSEISGNMDEGFIITNTQNFESGNEVKEEYANDYSSKKSATKHIKKNIKAVLTGDQTPLLSMMIMFIFSSLVLFLIKK